MSEFKLEKRKLTDLVSDIHKGVIQLPQFQRDYKWKPTAVLKLIDSLNKLHPAGSLLFLEIDTNKDVFIAYEKVRSAPAQASKAVPSYLILDGQQRLTSCHSALTNSGSKSYFIDLIRLKNEYHEVEFDFDLLDLFEKKIVVAKDHIDQPDQLLFSSHLLPFSFLLKQDDSSRSKEELRKKLYSYTDNLRNDAKIDKTYVKFVEMELENFLDPFFDYQFPTIILPKTLDISGVCKVFQTLNTTGLKLSAFDICVATLMPSKINIKEKLKKTKTEYPDTRAILTDDDTIILQSIALMAGKSPKKNNLPKNIDKVVVRLHWDNAEKYLNVCVGILDKVGVGLSKGSDLLPYQPVVPVLTAALAACNYLGLKHSEQTSIENKIKKWFYTVCLDLRYTEGTDNKMQTDFNLLVEWFINNEEPDYIKNGVIWNPDKVVTANKNGAFGKSIMVAVNSRQLQDFYTGDNVGFGSQILSNCQQHHIFPDARYKLKANSSSVFNFTYITSKSNQFIKDKRTDEYIEGIVSETKIKLKEFKSKLERHFIDERCYSTFEEEKIEDFLKFRADNIFSFLRNTIGINLIASKVQSEDQQSDLDENFDNQADAED